MKAVSRPILAVAALALLGAAPIERERKPGEGVLCMGGFIYFAQLQGRLCHAGKDPAYQKRLDGYVERLDAYLIRNFENGETTLKYFKDDQGLTIHSRPEICNFGDNDNFYAHMREIPPEKLDASINELLASDGKPSFGDCV